MVPLLVPEVFPPVDFSMQAHVFFGNAWRHSYISTCFCGKRFYFPTYIHRYEHEAILKPKTENNIGAPSAPQKDCIPFLGRRRRPYIVFSFRLLYGFMFVTRIYQTAR